MPDLEIQSKRYRSIWDIPWFLMPVLLVFIAELVFVYRLPYGSEILLLNRWREEPLNSIFRFSTKMGETIPYILAIITMFFWRYRNALLLLIAGIMVSPYAYFLKDRFGVTRPLNWLGDQGLRDQLVVVPHVELASGFTSFPSGHTIAAFTLYSLLALMLSELNPRWGLLCALLAILVGFSRIFLAQHFLTDVLGGTLFGLLLGAMIWQIGKIGYLRNNAALDSGFWQQFKRRAAASQSTE